MQMATDITTDRWNKGVYQGCKLQRLVLATYAMECQIQPMGDVSDKHAVGETVLCRTPADL